jgi:polysaccharide export outer membrane protein
MSSRLSASYHTCRHALAVAAMLIVLAVATAHAQHAPANQASIRGESPIATVVPPADYVIGADDRLSVVFWKEPEVSSEVRVRPDGKISLPLLRDVQAAGLTPDQLRQQLESAAQPFFADISATVMVTEIKSRKVFITGAVGHPGEFPLTGPLTVLQALALAGGFSEFADEDHVEVFRTFDGRRSRFTFNYKDVLKGRKPDLELKPGDTIVVR